MQAEITDRDMHKNYSEKVRQWIAQYRKMINDGNALFERWEALYSSTIEENDLSVQIIPDATSRLSAFGTAISNIQTICQNYDSGIDTNFERISV